MDNDLQGASPKVAQYVSDAVANKNPNLAEIIARAGFDADTSIYKGSQFLALRRRCAGGVEIPKAPDGEILNPVEVCAETLNRVVDAAKNRVSIKDPTHPYALYVQAMEARNFDTKSVDDQAIINLGRAANTFVYNSTRFEKSTTTISADPSKKSDEDRGNMPKDARPFNITKGFAWDAAVAKAAVDYFYIGTTPNVASYIGAADLRTTQKDLYAMCALQPSSTAKQQNCSYAGLNQAQTRAIKGLR